MVIPDSTEYIGVGAFNSLNQSNITLGNGVTSYYVVEGDTFAGYICKPENNCVIPSIPGVDTIKDESFLWHSLWSITVPEGIKRIGNRAFNRAAKNITLPNSVISMGECVFSGDTVITCEPGSFAHYYAKKMRVALSDSVVPTSFPISREAIISTDISEISKKDYSYPFENWIRLYVNSKYGSYGIKHLLIKTCEYSDIDARLYDLTNSLFSDEYNVAAKYYYVTFKTDKDIPDAEKGNAGYYRFDIQVVALYNADGKVILSGFVECRENLIDNNEKLYDFIKQDTRFVFKEYSAPASILNSQAVEIINVSDYSVVNDIVKNINFAITGDKEGYVPISRDIVAFFLRKFVPTPTVYMANLKTGEILFSKEYPYYTFLSSKDGVCVIQYSTDGIYSYDYVNDKGQIINQITGGIDYYLDMPKETKGSSYRLIQENRSIRIKNMTIGASNMLLMFKQIDFHKWLDYRLGEVIDSNRFIYTCYEMQGLAPGWNRTYIYDIRDGSSLEIKNSLKGNRYHEYAGYYGGKYFVKFCNTFDAANQIYILETEGENAGNLECITENVDKCLAIKDYAISSDGKYLALLTSTKPSVEGSLNDFSEHIVIVDIPTKKVIYEDEYEQRSGSVTYTQDGYFCINDGKKLIYIDTGKLSSGK